MLETSLTWKLAQEQCGEGKEYRATTQPWHDASLYAALCHAYDHRQLPRTHFVHWLMKIVRGNAQTPKSEKADKREFQKARNFLYALQKRFRRQLMNDESALLHPVEEEILTEALAAGVRNGVPTVSRRYEGLTGVAFAAENIRVGESPWTWPTKNTEQVWPDAMEHARIRVGSEQAGEWFRVIAVSTITDMCWVLKEPGDGCLYLSAQEPCVRSEDERRCMQAMLPELEKQERADERLIARCRNTAWALVMGG